MMSELVEPADKGHVHCNGMAKDAQKASNVIDTVESPPNGIHLKRKERIGKRDGHAVKAGVVQPTKDTDKKNSCGGEAQQEAAKSEDDQLNMSRNELIDKFSKELTMSLINSASSEVVVGSSDADSVRLKDLAINRVCTGKSEDAVDSTVVFPISKSSSSSDNVVGEKDGIQYLRYENEMQMSPIMQLITKDLSEPYSIYTYRYFIHNWPHLCFLAMHDGKYVGAIVCKLDLHKKISRRGYIAMLAIDESVRRRSIGTTLVKLAIEAMNKEGCDEVVLETEVTNKPALKLYENLGFVRDKRLFRYYLNGVDALRLKLWLR